MKNLFNRFFVIIAAMIAFAGCAKEEVDAPATKTKTIQFFAESIETRTAFGEPTGTTYPTLWTANDEKVHLSMNLSSSTSYDISPSDDFKTARFEAEIKDDESGNYTFYSVSPASASKSFSSENKYYNLEIPTSQTPSSTSVDEKAQLLVAKSETFTLFPTSVSMNYTHLTAYGKMSLVNLDLGEDNAIVSVSLTASKNIAHRYYYYPETGTLSENNGAATITINTSSASDIWFACAPVDVSNSSMEVVVNTTKGTFTKTINFPANRKFEAGKISKFSIDMTKVELEQPEIYLLVTDPAELTADSKVIIVGDVCAMSTTQNSNNRGTSDAITISDDKSYVSDPGANVQIITIEAGKQAGTVAFNVGDGYLYAASSSANQLKTETALSDNSSWAVTIAEGVATIKAQGTNTRNWLRYNSSNALFSCYASGQQDVAIYKLQGSGIIKENYLEVSSTAIEVEADATSSSFVVNSDLEWTVTSSDGITAEVADDNKTVNLSFAENTEAEVKTYTVTVSADGADPVTVTITQKAKIIGAVIEDGKYWIISSGKVAKPISGSYGYLYVDDVWTSEDGALASIQANAFTFTAVDGGYTIQDESGNYYYMTDTYNNFNVDATAPTDKSHIWSIAKGNDDSYNITNSIKGKYIQYSAEDVRFGSYDTEKGLLPTLVKVENTMIDIAIDASLSFTADAGSQDITLPKSATVIPSTDNTAFTAIASENVVTVSVSAATEAQAGTLTLVISYNGFNVIKTVALSQSAPLAAGEVEDVITPSLIGITGTSYTSWSDKKVNSSAVYAGQSSAGTGIQLRSSNSNSGIITTTSGGYVRKIVVKWNTKTTAGRILQIYGKSTAYSSPAELYSTSTQGTLLGTIKYGETTELVVEGDYEYLGMKSSSGAMYLDEISITWGN